MPFSEDLTSDQIEAVKHLGLTPQEAIKYNLDYYQLKEIKAELKKENALSLEDAVAKYKGLTYVQIKNIIELGFTREEAIKYDLVHVQREAVKNLGLTPQEASLYSLSYLQIKEIKKKLEEENPLSLKEILETHKALDSIQIKYMTELGLTREQVTHKNFGPHITKAIKAELKKENPLSLEEAVAKYESLSSDQVEGITELGLTREQVTYPNFGHYTLKAIKFDLVADNPYSEDSVESNCDITGSVGQNSSVDEVSQNETPLIGDSSADMI